MPKLFSSLHWITVCLLGLAAGSASAADIHADGVQCTLTDAILSANTATAVGGCAMGSMADDRIILDYDVVLTGPETTHSPNIRGVYSGLPKINTQLRKILMACMISSVRRYTPVMWMALQ